MRGLQRHLVAFGGMLAGSTLVFGFVLVMNSYTTAPPKEAREQATAFNVEKKKKKPPRRRKPKPRPKRIKAAAAKPAPMPNLSSAISSVAIDLPGFDSSQLGDLSEEVLGDTKKNLVMDEASVDEPPKAVSRVGADYPDKARKKGITGYVTMNLLIGVNGEVERVKVLDARPQGVFEEVALATIRKWRFAPAEYQAAHVKAWAKQTMRFELN